MSRALRVVAQFAKAFGVNPLVHLRSPAALDSYQLSTINDRLPAFAHGREAEVGRGRGVGGALGLGLGVGVDLTWRRRG